MAKIGVGIIGIDPDRSWGAVAHLPALRALPDDYEIVAVANSHAASARAAADRYGIPQAFGSAEELCASPAVDLVAVTVKVPAHRALVGAAMTARKHVYCEWPLGNGLDETVGMADDARAAGVTAVCGLQARFAPEIAYARDLIAQGYVGEVLSVTLVGNGGVWGPMVPAADAYTADIRNGATLLTIPLGHTLDAIAVMVGEIVEVGGRLLHRRTTQQVVGEDRTVPLTAPDQVLLAGRLSGGAALSVHYRGGTPRGMGLLIEINGTAGDIQIRGPIGHAQLADLMIAGASGDGASLEPLVVPSCYREDSSAPAVIGNIYRAYRQLAVDLATGSRAVPSFDDAVRRHRTLAAIEASTQANGATTHVDGI